MPVWHDVPLQACGLLDLKHAGNAGGVPDVVWPSGKRRSFSRRFLVPMHPTDLMRAHFSQACEPPYTRWEEPPLPCVPLPPIFTRLSQIIPRVTLRKTLRQLRRISECLESARLGDIKRAIALRPPPLHIPSHLMFTPEATGYGVLDLRPILLGLGPAVQLHPSSYPHAPPNSAVHAAFCLLHSYGFPDLQIVSFECHGFKDRCDMPLETMLSPPNISTLHAVAVFAKEMIKAREAGFISDFFVFCPSWPFVGDPITIAWRKDKPRLCWDKSGPRVPYFTPFNSSLTLADLPIICYVSIACLSRDAAILASSKAEVLVWGGDLNKFYRQSGRQRADVWKQGVISPQGCSFDDRCQFGDADQCNHQNRHAFHGIWILRRLIKCLDDLFPSRCSLVIQFIFERRQNGCDILLGVVFSFFDDVHGASINDQIFSPDGSPLKTAKGSFVFRAELHFGAMLSVFQSMGHSFGEDKLQPPSFTLTLLGALLRMRERHVVVHPEKRPLYCEELLKAETADSMCRDELNSLAHKMIYCSSIIVRMRPWLFPIFRCLYARVCTARALLTDAARVALRRCRLALEFADDHPLPFAAIDAFPLASSSDLMAIYADAAGDGAAPGWGYWWVMNGCLLFAWGEWTPAQLLLPIHALELWTSSVALMSAYSQHKGEVNPLMLEYTDNAASEFVADSQQSRCPYLQHLIAARSDFFDASGVCSLPQRVSSVHNLWADLLSRGEVARVIASAVRLGLRPCRLFPPDTAWPLLESLVSLAR